MLPQENCIDIESDDDCLRLFEQLDVCLGFRKLYDVWLLYNKEDWYSKSIVDILNQIVKLSNDIASYMSMSHHEVDVQIAYPNAESMSGKQFRTIIKNQIEWKLLRQFIRKNEFDNMFHHQPLTVQILCRLSMSKMKELIERM